MRRLAPLGRRALRSTDRVADGALRGGVELRESLAGAPPAFGLEPGEALEHDGPVALLRRIGRAHPFVDEVDYADGGGARRMLIRRNDEIREHGREAPL